MRPKWGRDPPGCSVWGRRAQKRCAHPCRSRGSSTGPGGMGERWQPPALGTQRKVAEGWQGCCCCTDWCQLWGIAAGLPSVVSGPGTGQGMRHSSGKVPGSSVPTWAPQRCPSSLSSLPLCILNLSLRAVPRGDLLGDLTSRNIQHQLASKRREGRERIRSCHCFLQSFFQPESTDKLRMPGKK